MSAQGASGASDSASQIQAGQQNAAEPEENKPDINGIKHHPPTRAAEYFVWPRDGRNSNAILRTEEFLKVITQQIEVFSYRDNEGVLIHWVVRLNDPQVYIIREEQGVESVEEIMAIADGA